MRKQKAGKMISCIVLSAALMTQAVPVFGAEVMDCMGAVDVEKFTLNSGFLMEPHMLYFAEKEEGTLTVLEAIERVVGKENIKTNGLTGEELKITAIRDESEEDGWLTEGEYGSESGWVINFNGVFSTEKPSLEQTVYDGDEIHICFSQKADASDLSKEYFSLFSLAELNALEDKELYLTIPEVQEAYENVLSVVSNLSSTSAQMGEAEDQLRVAVKNAKTQVEEIKNELLKAKENAKKELENYKSLEDYKEEQQKELTAAIQKGKDLIDQAKTVDEVNQVVKDTKAEIDAIKTKEEIEQENRRGDIDGNGVIDFLDINLFLRKLVEEESIDAKVGDMNSDGQVDFMDCNMLLKILTDNE